MNDSDDLVLTLGEDDVPAVVDVLTEAFSGYPVMRYVLGNADDPESQLRTVIRFFVMARVLRNEVVLGIGDRPDLDGAALVSRPDGTPSPPELARLREEVWSELGSAARARYESYGTACAPLLPESPHLHLNMVGVRGRTRGRGLGRRLIERVHRLSQEDPASEGVSLTTEDPANVPLYEHLGYRVLGYRTIDGDLGTWCMFRPNA